MFVPSQKSAWINGKTCEDSHVRIRAYVDTQTYNVKQLSPAAMRAICELQLKPFLSLHGLIVLNLSFYRYKFQNESFFIVYLFFFSIK